MIALMTTQRSVAYVVAAVIFIGGFFFALAQMRKGRAEVGSEIELAANRKPYLPDDELEGPKLNKALWTAFGLMAVTALIIPLYWLAEPGRQTGAVEHYDELFTERGSVMYTTGAQCVNCHSAKAVGGSASFVVTDENGKFVKQVTWTAPALNNVMYRFSTDEVKYILTYGRPGTPMPAWGVKGGGPNTDQQLDTVIDYLWSVQLTPTQVRQEVDDVIKKFDGGLYDRMMAVRKKNAGVLDATTPEYTRLDHADELLLGEFLFSLNDAAAGANSVSCARCHVPGASFGEAWYPVQITARGSLGFNLIGIESRLTEKQHFQLVMNGTEEGKLYGSVGLGTGKMPGFGINPNGAIMPVERLEQLGWSKEDAESFATTGLLSPEEVWSIVTYERNLSQERPDLRVAAAIEGKK